jgi:hypothetical protein
MNDKLTLSIAETVAISGLGRSTIYQAVARGDLIVRKAGRRSLVRREDLVCFLDRLPPLPAKPTPFISASDTGKAKPLFKHARPA